MRRDLDLENIEAEEEKEVKPITKRYFYASIKDVDQEDSNTDVSCFADCLVDVPGPSNKLVYYDAASLYPSSGKFIFG